MSIYTALLNGNDVRYLTGMVFCPVVIEFPSM